MINRLIGNIGPQSVNKNNFNANAYVYVPDLVLAGSSPIVHPQKTKTNGD